MGRLIVVDGPGGAGKGTLTKRLAAHFGYQLVDSGLFYRALAYKVSWTSGNPVWVARSLEPRDFTPSELRSDEVANQIPALSAIPEVREAINVHVRALIAKSEGTVYDGRAGAYEFPESNTKIYLTADEGLRAGWRLKQFGEKGVVSTYEQVLADIRARDKLDTKRAVFPLRLHPEAALIDATGLTQDEVFEKAVLVCRDWSEGVI